MLVLSRIAGQAITIGDTWEIKVAQISHSDATLHHCRMADRILKSTTLRIGEHILCGEQVRVFMVDINVTGKQKKVRLGIDSPRNMPVCRK